MGSLTSSYSGVFFNQNGTSSGPFPWSSGYASGLIYQNFYLPATYMRGTDPGEQYIPDISGFQILVGIGQADTAKLNYTLDILSFLSGWENLASGTVIGAHADGASVWMDVIFPTSIPIAVDQLGSLFRFGVTLPAGSVSTVWYTKPNPLPQQTVFPSDISVAYQNLARHPQAYQADNQTPLLTGFVASPPSVSLNFRMLGLVADNGTDFLGNAYRSAVSERSAGNVSTTRGSTPVIGSGQNVSWMSPPLPSRSAVASLYFDVRPIQSIVSLGLFNLINNPSFEYDLVNTTPNWWSSTIFSGTLSTFQTENTWSAGFGLQSLHVVGTSMSTGGGGSSQFSGVVGTLEISPSTGIPTVIPTTGGGSAGYAGAVSSTIGVVSNQPYTAQARVNNLDGQPSITLTWFDSSLGSISSVTVNGTSIAGLQFLQVTAFAPANAAFILVSLVNNAIDATVDCYWDEVMLSQIATVPTYGDGDTSGWQWTGVVGASPSAQVIQPSISGSQPVVIDAVNLNPLTPNMSFNVYYSQNDTVPASGQMTETDWESKLWTRVPQVFTATQAQTYQFPAPVIAKYMKVEFTNLQSQPYDPGNFVLPIKYKRFPTWVNNFFLGLMEPRSFTAGVVNVQYDLLDFAYNHVLDDLAQSPALPAAAPTTAGDSLTPYFSLDNADFRVDATTLSQINLVMNIFRHPSGSLFQSNGLLDGVVASLVNTNILSSTSENNFIPPTDYSNVSTTNREPLVLEQGLPAMYFFLTCRHAYQEVTARLDHNRAYFAGITAISFIRDNYTVASDTPVYIESGADSVNTDRNEFVIDPLGTWVTYSSS